MQGKCEWCGGEAELKEVEVPAHGTATTPIILMVCGDCA